MPLITVNQQPIFYSHHPSDAVVESHPPLVLIHGAGGTHLHWPPHLRRLPSAPVYAPDLPGHGRSGGKGYATIGEYREWLHEFVDALGLPAFVLAGHSMGGAIALDFALAYPERLVGLGLVGASARLRVAPAILNGIQTDFATTTANLIETMYGPTVDQPRRQRYLQGLREVDPAVLYADFCACDGFDVSARVGEINLPTLIICGQLDQMTPLKYSERLHAQLRHSEFHALDKTGHMAMIEQADATTQLLEKFLIEVGV